MKDYEKDLMLAELLIKVSAMERLLVKSGFLNDEELIAEMKNISAEIMSSINKINLFGTNKNNN